MTVLRKREFFLTAAIVYDAMLALIEGAYDREDPAIYLPFLSILIFFGHLFDEGPRWQMFPTYGIMWTRLMHCLLLVVYGAKFDGIPEVISYFGMVLPILCVGITLLLCVMFPIPEIPLPTRHGVGTVDISWDVQRRQAGNGYLDNTFRLKTWEFSTETTIEKKEFRVKIWYPCQPHYKTSKILEPHINEFWNKLPKVCHEHLKYTAVNSAYGVPVSDLTKWPVLIFSSGQNTTPEYYTFICEHVVSHGFIVIAPYVDDKDNNYPGPLKRRVADIRLLLKFIAHLNNDEKATLRHHTKNAKANPMNFLHQKMNLNCIGLFGHSFGGSTVINFLSEDETPEDAEMNSNTNPSVLRTKKAPKTHDKLLSPKFDDNLTVPIIDCGLAVDPWMFPIPTTDKPELKHILMVARSDGWFTPESMEKLQGFYNNASKGAYEIIFKDTLHYNFTDLIYYVSNSWIGQYFPPFLLKEEDSPKDLLGKADGKVVLGILVELTLAFFTYHFKNRTNSKMFKLRASEHFSFQAFFPQKKDN